MGKKKRVRNKARVDPTAAGAAGKAQLAKLAEEMGHIAENVDLVDKLDSTSAHDRAIGCGAVSHLLFQCRAQKAEALCQALIKRGVVKTLLKIIYDLDLNAATAAAKALRNFSLVGGDIASEALLAADATTIVLAIFTNDRVKSAPPAARQELFIHVFPLLASLTSQREVAVERFMQSNLVNQVLDFMQPDQPPLLIMEAVSFLCVVSEDNEPLGAGILECQPILEYLCRMLKTPTLFASTRSAVAGFLTNVVASAAHSSPKTKEIAAKLLSEVISTLSEAVSMDPIALASTMIANATAEKAKANEPLQKHDSVTVVDERQADAKEKKKGVSGQEFMSQIEWDKLVGNYLFEWKQSAMCVKQSLEVLTNIATMTDTEQETTDSGLSALLSQANERMSE